MQLMFSNRRLWSMIASELIVVSVIFVVLLWISRATTVLAVLFFVLFVTVATLAAYLLQLAKRRYIDITVDQIVVASPLPLSEQQIDCADVKRVVQRRNQLWLVRSDDSRLIINLNYLSSEDIRRLLMYIRYNPALKKKFL